DACGGFAGPGNTRRCEGSLSGIERSPGATEVSLSAAKTSATIHLLSGTVPCPCVTSAAGCFDPGGRFRDSGTAAASHARGGLAARAGNAADLGVWRVECPRHGGAGIYARERARVHRSGGELSPLGGYCARFHGDVGVGLAR